MGCFRGTVSAYLLSRIDRVAGYTRFNGFGRRVFCDAFNGLRPGHDAGEVRILVWVERTSIRMTRLPL